MNKHDRVDVIKVNILHFLFKPLPVEIPNKQFNRWKRQISIFIWNSVPKSGVKFKILQVRVYWCDTNYEAVWKEMEQKYLEIQY